MGWPDGYLMYTRNPEPGLIKIRIALPNDAWHGVEAVWTWAEKVSENLCLLRNVPFYAEGVSFNDRVIVEEVDGVLNMCGVESRGGHSTYRIFAKRGITNERVQSFLEKLKELHCDIESATDKLIAVDVLPHADIYKVYGALEEAQKANIIDFEKGHCGHQLRSKIQ
jgi:hypothetical protein